MRHFRSSVKAGLLLWTAIGVFMFPAFAQQYLRPLFRSTLGLSTQALPDKLGEVLSTADFGVPLTGDAQPALQLAMNTISAAGGGPLRLLSRQYPIIAADLVVPYDVRLVCNAAPAGLRPNLDYRTVPCALMPAPGRTVQMLSRSALDRVPVINAGLPAPPTDMRSGINYIAAFAGTGIRLNGDDVRVQGGFVLGFGQCIDNYNVSRFRADDVQGDCNAGIHNDQNHDVVRLSRIHFWPFALVHTGFDLTDFPVAGYANNGAGVVRLTLASPAAPALVSGDAINLSQAMGLPRAMRRRWTVQVIDSTHMDLVGSGWITSQAFTAATIAGSPCITVADNTNLGVGMLASSSVLPAGTVITLILEQRVCLSNAATATAVSQPCTAGPMSQSGAQRPRAAIPRHLRPQLIVLAESFLSAAHFAPPLTSTRHATRGSATGPQGGRFGQAYRKSDCCVVMSIRSERSAGWRRRPARPGRSYIVLRSEVVPCPVCRGRK